jgi:tRNA(Ile)-lysidine synthase
MTSEEKIKETIRKYNLLRRGDKVLVAVSGGPDSIALLHFLAGLREESGLHLEVAHLEHGIREEEARQDALHVAKMAEALALRFHLKRVDLPGMKAEERKGNLEQMGREERHRFFAALASDYGLSKVATGHTRDDQVETFFMWLLRGSGRKGLGGMPPIRRLTPEIPEEVFFILP